MKKTNANWAVYVSDERFTEDAFVDWDTSYATGTIRFSESFTNLTEALEAAEAFRKLGYPARVQFTGVSN